MSSLVLELPTHLQNVPLTCVGLSLGSLDLALAILQLDIDIEFLAHSVDVFALATDEVVGELLREVEGKREATLELVLLLLLNESKQALVQCINEILRTPQIDVRRLLSSLTRLPLVTVRDLDRDLTLRERLVVPVDVASDLVMELDRRLDIAGNDALVAAHESLEQLAVYVQHRRVFRVFRHHDVYTVLVADLASTLLAKVRVVERVYIHRLEAGGRMPADKVLKVGARLHSALLVTSVDLPVARAVRDDTRTMHAFKLSQCPTTLEVTSDVAEADCIAEAKS
ncbi:hypothetical protein KC365_g50 [Hortaea werneckii]|nr:hypothetical protein KC365_g50 [Hortaea werneckii]